MGVSGGILAFSAAVALALAPLSPSSAHAATLVTSYEYNPDGALTALTTRTGTATATTTYLTWDNFVPDEADPTTGTIYAGNGNLVAVGPKPNTGTSLFGFDRRDRLTSFRANDRSAAYGYHATGRLAASTADGGSGFGFYYAGGAMANLRQTDTDLWSARLGPVRYLDDGTEEVLLTPRKDVAATYDPADAVLASYSYDAFGKESDAPLSTAYDLNDNPHRYAGAYRDPLWGGYYLEARWYDPDLAIFLSRDPAAGFHPYSYGDGNPVMKVDPTGMSAQTAGHVTGESSPGDVLFNVFVAPLISMFTKEYWSDVFHNRDQAAVFLAAGIAAEIGFFGLDILPASGAWRWLSTAHRWTVQGAADIGINVGQAAVSATHGGKFDLNAFGENLEGLPMGLFYARGVAGIGRRTHLLRGEDVADRIMGKGDNNVLVFRVRTRRGEISPFSLTSPVMEALHIGNYHEKILAVSNQYWHTSELLSTGMVELVTGKKVIRGEISTDIRTYEGPAKTYLRRDRDYKFEYVGEIAKNNYSAAKFRQIDPNGHGLRKTKWQDNMKPYSLLRNNCQRHVYLTVKSLYRAPWRMQ